MKRKKTDIDVDNKRVKDKNICMSLSKNEEQRIRFINSS